MDLGLEQAGIKIEWQVEIDEYRRSILAKHWPDTPRSSDIRGVSGQGLKQVDLICGGFPCQDLSVAGKREGLKGERSGLFFELARVVRIRKPRWILVENVPGLLSQDEGEAMGQVIETFSELGYGLSWRVLDSQYFGVPQRRRRVYIVGRLGGPCPREILFEPESGEGSPQEGGKAEQEVAKPLGAGSIGRGRRQDLDNESYIVYAIEDPRGKQSGGSEVGLGVREGPMYSLQAKHQHGVAVVGEKADSGGVREAPGVSGPLDVSLSCECSDARRYALCGDAVTTVVARWIGERLLVCA